MDKKVVTKKVLKTDSKSRSRDRSNVFGVLTEFDVMHEAWLVTLFVTKSTAIERTLSILE